MRRNFRLDKPKRCYDKPRRFVRLNLNHGTPGLLQQVAVIVCKPPNIHSADVCVSYLISAVEEFNQRNKEDATSITGNKVSSIGECTLEGSGVENWGDECVKLKYFTLLRCSLLHKKKEVRAAGIRLLRHITKTEKDVHALLNSNTIPLLVRCIDICIGNHRERIHGIRYVRDILHLAPSIFPVGLARCLIAIAREGPDERDRLVKAAQATLNELAVLNPMVFINCEGVTAFLHSILDCPLPRINESLVSALMFLVNDPKLRPYCSQLHMILSPFSDFLISSDKRDFRIQASCLGTLATLRSWPGLFTLYQPEDKALKSLIDLLLLPNEYTWNVIIDFLYELFRIPLPKNLTDYASAIKDRTNAIASDPDSWRLQEGFVVAEAKVLLPHIAKFRPNLIQNYFSLILFAFMKEGLFHALCNVIVTSSITLSIKTTVLLGELLHQSNQNLPLECGSFSHALPLLAVKASSGDPRERDNAAQAISALLSIARGLLSQDVSRQSSLYLNHILSSNQDCHLSKVVSANSNPSKTSKWLGKDHDDLIIQTIKDSGVLCDESDSCYWNWQFINPILRWPSNALQALDEGIYKIFLKKLLNHFKPSSYLFSRLELTFPRATLQAEALLLFCDFLLKLSSESHTRHLSDFLGDVGGAIEAVACERPTHDAVFSPSNINATLSQYYFLAVGLLTRSSKGYDAVLKAGIYEQILKLIDASACDMYSKLISTSLDYSINGVNRTILTKILTSGMDTGRMYATQLLGVFVRAKVEDFHRWGVELLVNQLYEQNKLVAFAALDVLDEALDDEEYLEAVLSATPSVPHLGDRGQLLLVKMVSSPKGFRSYQECNFVATLLDKWASTFNIKYVKLMQAALSESLTHLRRGEDGFYGRRTGSRHVVHDVFILPHLYGCLTMHVEGFSLLIQHDHIKTLVQIVKEGSVSDYQEIYKLKAAVWALGHLGRSTHGVNFLSQEEVIKALVHLCKHCPVYSVRGTTFFSLCLIATTWNGMKRLQKHGWESVRRHHHERTQSCRYFGGATVHAGDFATRQSESDIEDQKMPKAGFYIMDESEDDMEQFSLYDLASAGYTPRKYQTLPHDAKPPSFMGHQRSFSDCAPVMEDSVTPGGTPQQQQQQEEQWTRTKRGSKLKNKIMSSFRRRSGKRRDSVESRDSNSSSASERLTSFLRPSKYFHRSRKKESDSEEAAGEGFDDSETSRSQSITDGGHSDEDGSFYKDFESPSVARPQLSPIASGASLSTVGSKTVSEESPWKTPATCRSFARSCSLQPKVSNYAYQPIRSFNRRGFSESSHEDAHTKNSLRDFLSSSHDKTLFNTHGSVPRSASGCSDLSSVRSLGHLTRVGSGSVLSPRLGTSGYLWDPTTASPSGECFLGLTLPVELDDLMYDASLDKEKGPRPTYHFKRKFPAIFEEKEKGFGAKGEEMSALRKKVPSPSFEYHSKGTCLRCSALPDFEEEEIKCSNQDKKKEAERSLMRKEVLTLVNNLMMTNNSAESGLLSLKYQLPGAFQDPCLYSEVSAIMSNYSYRLSARRVLQELFLDLDLTVIFDAANDLLLQSSNSELTEAVNENVNPMRSEPKPMKEFVGLSFEDFDSIPMEEDC